MPQKREKKQFSLSLLLRVFLVVIVVVSIIVFATGIMRYNELMREQEVLREQRNALQEEKEELSELQSAEGKESYIVRIARKVWHLFYPDEEIIYNDWND